MSRRRNSSLGDTLIAFSNVLLAFSTVGADLLGFIQRGLGTREQEAAERLKLQGLALKNQRTAAQIAHEHEKIHLTVDRQVKSTYEIELLNLKVKREKWAQRNAGIGGATFKAEGYPDPGDVRRGEIPPHNFPN